jgi:hypothetical protein
MTRPRWPWAVIVVGGVLVGVGMVTGGRGSDVAVGTMPSIVPIHAPPVAWPVSWAGPPVRLLIPGQHVDAPVVPVDVAPDGALGVPDDPGVVGWWGDGAGPGGSRGSVVLDGHVDTRDQGPGALFRLAELLPGDAVELVTGSRTVRYTVAAVRTYAKGDLPADVFDQAAAPRLVLISCGGPFDRARRSYRDNVVVYGVPAQDSTRIWNG